MCKSKIELSVYQIKFISNILNILNADGNASSQLFYEDLKTVLNEQSISIIKMEIESLDSLFNSLSSKLL
jgi:hypothetical protein